MKVKNIMFSGVMAAILGATGANAAINVASQGYVDSKVGAVETNIINNYLSKTDAENTYLTEEQVTQQITNVVGTADEGLLADVAENASAIATLETTKANAADVYTKDEADGLLATKADLADVYKKTETYTQSEVQAQISETLAGIDGGTIELKGYATETYADNAATSALNSAKTYTDEEIAKLSAEGGAVKANADAIAALQTSVGTDSVADQIAAAVADKANTADVYSKTVADETFATKTALNDVDAKFANYTTTEALTTTLNSYATTTALKAEEEARIAADEVATTALANVYTKEQADEAFDAAGSASAVEAKLKLLATAEVPTECQSDSSMCVLSMTSSGTFAWTPLTAPLDSTASN